MADKDVQDGWIEGYEQNGYIILRAEFTAWRDGGSPEAGKYMVHTYTLGSPPGGYPDEYIETGQEEDAGSWLDGLIGDVWDEIADADYLYLAFSRDNFVVDEDGIKGKKSEDGGNLHVIRAQCWPILGKTFLNDEGVWVAAGIKAIAPPAFLPEPGTYWPDVEVRITCDTEGAIIYYTTDGTEPTEDSTEYNGRIWKK